MQLTKVKYNGNTIAEYEYDELGRRTLLTYGNDANTVYEYDLAPIDKSLSGTVLPVS